MVKLQPDKELDKLVCVKDFAYDATQKLSKNALEYFQSGADDEVTLRENFQAYLRWKIIPRVFRDVAKRSMMTKVLGKDIQIPIGISPMGFQRVAHPDGEIASAKATVAAGGIFTLSTFATTSIEDVANAIPTGRKWLQLFIFANKTIVESLIRRAEMNGFEALVITVDSQYVGKRRKNARRPFKLPSHLKIANFDPIVGLPDGTEVVTTFSNISHLHNDLDFSMTWDIIHWLKKTTNLPIIIKGVLSPADAELAVKNCCAGIWVSNHGGRALDHGIATRTFQMKINRRRSLAVPIEWRDNFDDLWGSRKAFTRKVVHLNIVQEGLGMLCTEFQVNQTIDMLPQIAEKVSGKCEIYVDGGIQKGSDVFKALALGANAVFIGRPFIWGLASGGEEGAKKVFQIITEELDLTMALAGAKSISDVKKAYVTNSPSLRCNL